MRAFGKARIALAVVLVGVLAAGLWWKARQPKGAHARGGANISAQLPDRVHFRQRDPRWAGDRLGGLDIGSMGGYGCTVSCAAMAMTNLGYPTDPGRLNAELAARGGFTEQGWLRWGKISELTNGALRAEVHDAPSLEAMDACLARGAYPIVKFMIYGMAPHWVILVGKRDGEYLVRDPLLDDPDPVTLSSQTSSVISVRCIGAS